MNIEDDSINDWSTDIEEIIDTKVEAKFKYNVRIS